MYIHVVAAFCCLVFFGLALAAQPVVSKAETDAISVPTFIEHHGERIEAAGSPVGGTCDLKFGWLAALTGATAVWAEVRTGAVATSGVFGVEFVLQPADAAVYIGGRGQRR
jgi:hypothetical protein